MPPCLAEQPQVQAEAAARVETRLGVLPRRIHSRWVEVAGAG
ncbi:MAG: hypothetical protein ABIO70_16035 [Pseudomonadota bacterium]